MNVTCNLLYTSVLNLNWVTYFVTDSIDTYSPSSNHLHYGISIANQSTSFANLKAARRFYGLRLLVDRNYFSILNAFGAPVERFADSTGALPGLLRS